MKKLLSLAIFFFALSAITFAQEAPATETQTQEVETAKAKFEFETTTIDYGTIEQGSDPYRYFKFTNTGVEPAVITHAKGSCGCTVPTWPKEPVLPGQSAEIKVRYDTKRVGPFTKRVTLSTDYSDEKIVLTIKGKVDKKAAEPEGVPAKQSGVFGG